MGRHSEFTVLGQPFFSVGGQTHNSSSYYPKDMERSFASVRALSGNTVSTPLCWDAFEPREGVFREDYVRGIIDEARRWGMHLVLLWFGTWKNGTMEYTPAWVKLDRQRFPRALCKDGTATACLSPHSEANRRADEAAFCRLLRVIRDYDGAVGTVLAVQVENESGMLAPTRRDFGPDGQRDFEAQVPAALLGWARSHPEGRLAGFWRAAGSRESGSWAQVFGRYGAEACSAWHTARYIDSIAAAGKAVYDVFLYANVWMDGGETPGGWDLGGLEYPCGGAVSKSLEVWYAACQALDAIAPDNYAFEPGRHMFNNRAYANAAMGWPLFVPESHANALNATLMFRAIGEWGAIGYHIFGCESVLDDAGALREQAQPMCRSMQMLLGVAHLIQRHRTDGRMHALWQLAGQDSAHLALDGWKCRVCYTGPGYGWNAMDFRHHEAIRQEGNLTTDLHGETGRGLLFQVSQNEFYLVGHKLRLLFNRYEPEDGSISPLWLNASMQANSMGTLIVEEGSFVDGVYVPLRTRSGDEARHGVWAQADCGVIHFMLAD